MRNITDKNILSDFGKQKYSLRVTLFLILFLIIGINIYNQIQYYSPEKTFERAFHQIRIGEETIVNKRVQEQIEFAIEHLDKRRFTEPSFSFSERSKNPLQLSTHVSSERYNKDDGSLLEVRNCTLLIRFKKREIFNWDIIDVNGMICE